MIYIVFMLSFINLVQYEEIYSCTNIDKSWLIKAIFFNPFTAIGMAYAVPVIFGVFAIWTALAVSIIIIVITIN
jgi:hypothetical protein